MVAVLLLLLLSDSDCFSSFHVLLFFASCFVSPCLSCCCVVNETIYWPPASFVSAGTSLRCKWRNKEINKYKCCCSDYSPTVSSNRSLSCVGKWLHSECHADHSPPDQYALLRPSKLAVEALCATSAATKAKEKETCRSPKCQKVEVSLRHFSQSWFSVWEK